MKTDLRKAYAALGIVSFFWGTTYLAARVSALHMPGFFVAGMRQLVSGLILSLWFVVKGSALPGPRSLLYISVQSVLLLCISNGLVTWALQYIPSGLAAIIAAMVPLFVALFSILLQNFARLSKMMFAGLGIGFLGILTIFYQHLSSFANPDFVLGIVLACIVTVSWSIGTVYASKHNPQINLLFAVGLQMLIAGIIMMSISYITGYYTDITQANTDSLISLAYLIVVGSLITYSAYVFAVSKLPPTLVSVYAYINPVVALFAGWIILKEELGLHALAGTMIVLLGIFLVNRGYKKQQHAN